MPRHPAWAYVIRPASNAGYLALARLQKAGVSVFRAVEGFTAAGVDFEPGAWIVPPGARARQVLEQVSRETGLQIFGLDHPPVIRGFRIKAPTRVGLWKGANNMPGGWLLWLFEQYGFTHQIISSTDFVGDLSAKYDVIVLP